MFDPEKVERLPIHDEYAAGEPWCVRLSDYNQLLELYRGLLKDLENMRDLVR